METRNLRFKIQEIAADRFNGVQYPRMIQRQAHPGIMEQWTNFAIRLCLGIWSIYLALFSLAVIAAGLFAFYILFTA